MTNMSMRLLHPLPSSKIDLNAINEGGFKSKMFEHDEWNNYTLFNPPVGLEVARTIVESSSIGISVSKMKGFPRLVVENDDVYFFLELCIPRKEQLRLRLS
ncbi:hypothetical protein Tco_1175980 [Tanacetum coccineum]